VIEPLRLSLDVTCTVEHAFDVWTSRIATWWPPDHTVTGDPGAEIVLEAGVGGRIYERALGGVEHEWGEVTVWEPPTRFGYMWHLSRDRAQATEVEIRFVPQGGDGTRVEIEHSGWERLGADAEQWRDRNTGGWQNLLPHYVAELERG
jgi:Activator of Hsp90 ATPase homolog 1-like protein